MNKVFRRFSGVLPMLGLMFLLVACGSAASPTESGNSTTSNADTAPNIVPDIEDSALVVSGAESINLDDETRYTEIVATNYAVSMGYNFTGVMADGSELYREIILSGERNINPSASYFRMDPNHPSIMDGYEYFEIADIGGIDYLSIPGEGCQVFSNNEFNNPFDTMLDEGGMLMGDAHKIGSNETINGVLVDVYEITSENLDLSDPTSWEITELHEGKVYIAQADGRVIRLMFSGRGTSELLTGDGGFEGGISYQLDFTPTNENYDIQPPEGCLTTAEEFPWPKVADSSNVTILDPLFSYSTNVAVEEVMEFYKTEMANLGYAVTEEVFYGTIGALSFANGGDEVRVSVGPDSTGIAANMVLIVTP